MAVRRMMIAAGIVLLGAFGVAGLASQGTAGAQTGLAQAAGVTATGPGIHRAVTPGIHSTVTPGTHSTVTSGTHRAVTLGIRRALATPPAPFLESVSSQGLGGLVSWNPDPVADGVTQYTVEALPAKGSTPPPSCTSPVTVSVPASDSAAVVGGLCTNVAYVAKVRATNAAGPGAYGLPSNPFDPLPAQVPGAPLITSVTGRDQALVVSWSAPMSNGGEALSGYQVTATGGGTTVPVSVGPTATSATVPGLTDGTSYQISVVAQNPVGSSAAATSSGTPQTAYPPAAPTQFTAAPDGSGNVDLSWQPPADDGGASISSYQVTYEEMVLNSSQQWVPAPGATPQTVTVSASAASFTVSGLSPANAFWSFSIAAVNSAGTGTPASAGQPVAPQTATTSSTVVLTASTMAALGSNVNGSLTWPAPAPSQITGLTAGDTIVAAPAAAAPQGLLDTVESVSQNASGGYVIGVAQAPLSAAFTGLSLASAVNPLSTEGGIRGRFQPALPGIRVLPRVSTGLTFSEDITLSISFGAGPVQISGEIDFTPTVGMNIALTHGFLGVPDGAIISASASLGVKASLQATLQGSTKVQIGELVGAPEDYQVGPVPVVVVPKVPIFLTASGQISTEVSASITIGAQATWNSQNPGSLSVKNLSTPLSVSGNPLQNVSASATVGFAEQPQMDLYDASGPDFEVDENLAATVNPFPPSGGDYFTITPSLSEKIGWDVDLLNFHASIEAEIAAQTFPIFAIPAPPSAFMTVTPANPSVPAGGTKQFTATRSSGGPNPVTWSLIGNAGDTISSTGLLTTVAPAGRTLIVVATDSTGAVGETTVTVGTTFSPPANLQATSALDGKSATLTWQPPSKTGGSGLKSYTIVTSPQTVTTTAAGTANSATITHLTPGVSYDVSVYATNSGGLRSQPGSIEFTPSVTCSITFTSSTSTDWSTAANWDKKRVPNSSDLVCINGGSTVSLTSAATVYGLTLQGVLTTTGSLTATDLLAVQGELTGAGTVTAAPGATLNLDQAILSGTHLVNDGQGTVTVNGTEVAGKATLENAGTLTLADGSDISWDGTAGGKLLNDAGGTISYGGGSSGAEIDPPMTDSGTVSAARGTLAVTGTVTVTASSSFSGGGTIRLESTVKPSGSGVQFTDVTVDGPLTGPGTLTVPAGGSVAMNPGSALAFGIDLVNRGNLTLAAGGGVVLRGASTLENAGTLTLADGSDLAWDGNTNGKLLNDAGATISYGGGVNGAEIDPPMTDGGTVSASGGILMVTGKVTLTSTNAFGGGGAILLEAPVSPSGSGVDLSGVTVDGTLTGPGTLTVPAGGTVLMDPGSALASGIDLVNQGNLTITAGRAVQLEGASTLENAGTLTLADNTDLGWDGNTKGKLVNDAGAAISYGGGSSGAEIDPPITNSGTVSASGGTLTVTGPVTVTSTGSFTGNGTILLESTVSPSGSGVDLSGVTVTGALTGPGTLTVPTGGSVTLNPGSSLNGIDLVNQGILTLATGPQAELEGASTLENAGTLTLADSSDLGWDGNSGGQLINDASGTITYAGGPNGAEIDPPFDNHGAVSVAAGTLYVYNGNTTNASDTGSYSATGSGVIDFASGARVLGSTFTFNGPGQLAVTGGQVTVPGAVTIANLAVSGSGEVSGPGQVTVPSGGQLSLQAGATLDGGLTLINDGAASIQTSSSGGAVSVSGGTVMQNFGTMTLADSADIAYPADPGQLINEAGGTVSYAGGVNGAQIAVPFDNHGTVTLSTGVRGGTLYIESGNTTGASDTGTYSASSTGVVEFDYGTRVLGSTFTFNGPGRLNIVSGQVVVPGSVSIPNLGVIASGDLTGPGRLTIPSGGKLSLQAGATLSGRLTVVNDGTANVQTPNGGDVSITGGTTLQNFGTLALSDDGDIAYPADPGQIINEAGATLSYTGGTLGATIDVPFDNYGTVAANVATRGGTLYIDSGNTSNAADTGTYSASSQGAVNFEYGTRVLAATATLKGPGAIQVSGGDVIDSAVGSGPALQLQSGTLEITPQASGSLASFVENSPATLQFDVSSATPQTEPAQIGITGSAALGGTFVLEPAAGFVPPAGTVLHLLDYASVSGKFAAIGYPAGNVKYTLTAGTTSMTVTASPAAAPLHHLAVP
ncbi:MAG TPA: fibronectin type III domain-containing protein [Streptosporangiaceae bacterium]|nr:fibronectin type III domain-containing protein [Streptosporangiaceae bacterium]